MSTILTKPLAWAVVAALVGGGIVIALVVADKPEPLETLERAGSAGERARSHQAEIVQSLETIAENLERGRVIEPRSARIRDLTEAQRESLEDLIALLRSQLDALDRTATLVGDTERSTARLAELSEEQVAILERAVAALRRIEESAQEAGSISADLARAARYGARLAEDSRDAFSTP